MVDGDVMLCIVTAGSTDVGTWTAPSDSIPWLGPVVASVAGGFDTHVFWKFVPSASGEPTDYQFDYDGTNRPLAGGIIAIGGVDTAFTLYSAANDLNDATPD